MCSELLISGSYTRIFDKLRDEIGKHRGNLYWGSPGLVVPVTSHVIRHSEIPRPTSPRADDVGTSLLPYLACILSLRKRPSN